MKKETYTQVHDDRFSSCYVNFAEERLGTKVLSCSDDFFAEKENLIKPGRGIFIEDKYTERGKWMDGWESRRKRGPGHDYCLIQLGLNGIIRGLDIDTNHFTGNHPEAASLEGAHSPEGPWSEILPKSPLNPGVQNFFEICGQKEFWQYIRFNIFPDGGVARLRVYGDVKKDWSQIQENDVIDLLAVENEGRALICNDMYFSHKDNLIMPGRGVNMGDGWETKRKRGSGHDWVVLKLGRCGLAQKIEIDTAHFKGNYPESFSLDFAYEKDCMDPERLQWNPLIRQTKLQADHQHFFESEILSHEMISHVRLNIFPDGGVSRLRLFGVRGE